MLLILTIIVFLCSVAVQASEEPFDVKSANEQMPARIFEDWVLQDAPEGESPFTNTENHQTESAMTSKVLEELAARGENVEPYRAELKNLESLPGSDPAWKDFYTKICKLRRLVRTRILAENFPVFVFAKHFNMNPSFYAYTEGLSDAQAERIFSKRTALCLVSRQPDGSWVQSNLISDPEGVIRDPIVSFDGTKIIFAWKKSDRKDDYHLYEYTLQDGKIRQLTEGLGHADYEPCVLPNGEILFSSSRCAQVVDCWWTEVSNLYRCDADGGNIRRVGFDQVHTTYPSVLPDGKISYTRWDYNDRGQVFPQALFQMNMDGTAQTECYGNNSWFPTSIQHARGIPNSHKIAAVLAGHHTPQRGKLAIIDTTKGRQETSGIQLIAPVRDAAPDRIDAWGQDGDQFMHPYPLNEREFVVAYNPDCGGPRQWKGQFGIYYMDIDGHRELLAFDSRIACAHPFAVKVRPAVPERPSAVDDSLDYGTYYVQDVYLGAAMEGIERGTAKTLRVIALKYRAVGIGSNGNGGPGGGAMVCTPIAVGQGAWDVKVPLGDTPLYPDGSACFRVPSRTPVYFQVLDENGHAIQTMRSWSTLQNGENFSCLGCHEDKNSGISTLGNATEAAKRGPVELQPIAGISGGFSFPKHVQPILDKHCVRCHDNRDKVPPFATGALKKWGEERAKALGNQMSDHPYSLRGDGNPDTSSKRIWSDSYLNLVNAPREPRMHGNPTPVVNWINVHEAPPMLPPYKAGAANSRLLTMFTGEKTHNDVRLSPEELEKIALWLDLLIPYCGDYVEANDWNEADWERYRYYIKKR